MPQYVIAKFLAPGGLILMIFVFSISHYTKKSDVFKLGEAAVYQQLAKQGASEDASLDMAWWESWSYADRGQTGNAHFVLCNKPRKVEHEGCFQVSAEKKEGQWKVRSVAMMNKQKK